MYFAAKEAQKSVPRRKLSERKAKDEVKSKLKGAIDSEDEMLTSSDSDPSWTPRDDVSSCSNFMF